MSKKAIYNLTQNIKVTGDIASYTFDDKVEKFKATLTLNWKKVFDDAESIIDDIQNIKDGVAQLDIPIRIKWENKE